MVTLLDELDQAGVVFRSATEPFDTSTPMGRMLVQMLGMFAQFERDTIIDRVIGGMERKAAKGKWKAGSDYLLTGRMRCLQCGKAMIGTRATGRHKTYRYYTCWTLARYDSNRCDFTRLNADAVDTAILDALATFYRTQHTLITDAITTEQHHHTTNTDRRAELTAITAELTKTNHAIDRYLAAFERGTIDDTLVADRLHQLRTTTTQLRNRHDELTLALDDAPTIPDRTTLEQVADHIAKIISAGNHNQTKALIETLVARVTITGPDRLIPVFRIPNPTTTTGPSPLNQRKRSRSVRFAQ